MSITTWSEGNWLLDAEKSVAALFDTHIHDVCCQLGAVGKPSKVYAKGKKWGVTDDGIDKVNATYIYGNDGPKVHAECFWTGDKNYAFRMEFVAEFENANLVFTQGKLKYRIHGMDRIIFPLTVGYITGYQGENTHFVDCIRRGSQATRGTIQQGYDAVKLVMAEQASITSGQAVNLTRQPIKTFL